MTREQREQLEVEITRCDSQEEFEKLVNERPHVFEDHWGDYFRETALTEHDLSLTDISRACGISYSKVRGYCKQVPSKRIDVILLAMQMGMTVEETNDLLVNRAKYHRLYAKNPLDVICIYLLVVGCTKEPAKMYKAYKEQYYKLQKLYKQQNASGDEENTGMLQSMVEHNASGAELDPAADRTFYYLMQRLIPQFSRSYAKLIDFIDSFFPYLEMEEMKELNNRDLLDDRKAERKIGKKEKGKKRGGAKKADQLNSRYSPNECFGSDESYRKKYYDAISDMHKEHKVPDRLFLVSLGVRLHMTVENINRMLDLAGMGPLCADDRLEAAIVYVLEEVNIQNPSTFLNPQSMGREKQYESLQEFSLKDELERLKRTGMDVAEDNPIFDDIRGLERLSEQDLKEYLKWKLEDMQIFFGDSEKLRDKLIGLL